MSKSNNLRFLSFVMLVLVVFSLGVAVYADTSPAATDATTPTSSMDGPLGTSPESTQTDGTNATPDSSTMMDPDITTTPDTADTMPDHDNTLDGDNKGDDGFNYTGLVIALVIAAAVILLVILLVPKNKDKR